MFYSLSGTVVYTDPTTAVIDCGGVGYKCSISTNTLMKLPPIGEKGFLFTYLNVRQDAVDLFGFADNEELIAFKLLISVNGVGAKAALSILSDFSSDKLAYCVSSGDSKSLTRAQGIGTKTAQRIVLELKDKMSAGNSSDNSNDGENFIGIISVSKNSEEAVSALVTLGYSQSEASIAIGKLDSSLSVESLVKEALKSLF